VSQFAEPLARGGCAFAPRNSRGFFISGPITERITEHGSGFGQGVDEFLKRSATTRFLPSALLVSLLSIAPPFAQACTAQSTSASVAKDAFRTVSDETGRTVRIPVPVRRLVSLAPSMTETIYALGMEDLLVGDTDYCDYPAAAARKHKVGGAINPSLEEIASLKPDLVLVTKGFNRLETVQQLERLGIAAYATDPHTIDDIRSSLHKLADLLGNPTAGETLDGQLLRQESDLRQRLENTPSKRVLFVVWTEPLISIGKHTFIADALIHAGANSVVESSQDWPQMSLEEMVRLQPDFLVFASSHSEAVSRDMEALAKRPGWDELDAVKHRRYAVISEGVNRPAPRLFSAVEELARQLHPEAFTSKSEPSKTAVPPRKS
jgi:iron complex transport system substrate-binding protein